MIKLVIHFILLGFLMAVGLWIANQPGSLLLTFRDYEIATTPGIFFLLLCALVIVASSVWQAVRWILQFPFSWRRSRQMQAYKKSAESFVQTLEALTLGNTVGALKFARRARERFTNAGIMSGPNLGLGLWLEAHTLKAIRGVDVPSKAYQALVDVPATAALGRAYLAEQALATQHYDQAMGHLEALLEEGSQAFSQGFTQGFSKRPWAALNLAKLYIHAHRYEDAATVLDRCQPEDEAGQQEKHHLQAVLAYVRVTGPAAHQAPADDHVELLSYATEYDPTFVPAVVAYATALHRHRKDTKSVKVLELAWSQHPSIDVGMTYIALAAPDRPLNRFREAQKLHALAPYNLASFLLVIRTALEAQLWGEARAYVQQATEAGVLDTLPLVRQLLPTCLDDPKSKVFSTVWPVLAAFFGKTTWQCTGCFHLQPAWSVACGACEGVLTLHEVEG